MKTKKYYLTLVVVIGILCPAVLGEVDLPLHKEEPFLLGRANPALAGIEGLYFDIVMPEAEAKETQKDGLVWKKLRAKVESKLEQAGIRIAPQIYDGIEVRNLDLKVDIDMLKLEDSQQYIFRIQTSLARLVYLTREHTYVISADVWKTEPVMRAVSIKAMPAAVTNKVLDQVETFISAYLAANQKDKQPSDANDINAATKRRVGPIVGSIVVEYKYVAPKNSKVFHKPECSSAKRIKPKNLVGYNNRDEAIKAGKRPCKICKP